MANRKITELNALTGANATDTDVFAIVDISADETKKMTLGELKEAFDTGSGFVRITGDTMTGPLDVQSTITADGLDVSSWSSFGAGGTQGKLRVGSSAGVTFIQSGLTDTAGSDAELRFTDYFGVQKKMSIGSGGDISFYNSAGTSAQMVWDASAESLGIGTSSPTNVKLQINDSLSGTAGTGHLAFGETSSPFWNFRLNTSTADLILDRSYGGWQSTPVIAFDRSSGNVGIGVTDPDQKLEVNGVIKTSLGSGGLSMSGYASPDMGYFGYNYFNNNGTETVGQSARSSHRIGMGNGATNAITFDYRAPSAAANTWSEAMRLDSSGTLITKGAAVFNEDGADKDFRVESDSNAHMLFVDAGASKVSINTSSTSNGILSVYSPTTYGKIFMSDSTLGYGYGAFIQGYGVGGSGGYFQLGSVDANTQTVAMQVNQQATNISFLTRDGSAGTSASRLILDQTGGSGAVFNEPGSDYDFRVESDSNANMLFVDAGNNNVGIGKAPGSGQGTLQIAPQVAATNYYRPAGNYAVFGDSGGNGEHDWVYLSGSYTDTDKSVGYVMQDYNGNFGQYAGSYIRTNQAKVRIGHLVGGANSGTAPSLNDNFIFDTVGGAVFNERGSTGDFRVESDSRTDMFIVDAGSNKIGIKTSSPVKPLSLGSRTGANLSYLNGTTNTVAEDNGIFVSYSTTDEASIGYGLHLANNANTNGARSPIIGFSALSASDGFNHMYAAINGVKTGNGSDTNWNTGSIDFSTGSGTGPNVRMTLDYLGGLTLRPQYLGSFVWNEDSADADFRVESNNNANAFLVYGSNGQVAFSPDAGATTKIIANGSNNTTGISFRTGGFERGNIYVFDTGIQFNTTSDERLKENITDAAGVGELLDEIQVRQFDWKVNGEHQRYGMIAQEVQRVMPEVVTTPSEPDQMMSIDYSKLVPMLVKELQTLRARIAALENA